MSSDHLPPPVQLGGIREGVELIEYLHFAHVNPADLIVQWALDNLCITHYSAFQNFKATELKDAGKLEATIIKAF
ncbi:uncharacterized protein VP01_3828g1 [Puccinia sorghi]|uniref:Uncharacterized protein n=1 Tax=Puccinia sorghi TaxID=27349 RepID=A0A0L6UV42_9BASI|nr:uncharacterized protein VP01_3828g1 [Puccinia sorghi]